MEEYLNSIRIVNDLRVIEVSEIDDMCYGVRHSLGIKQLYHRIGIEEILILDFDV